MMKRIVFRFSAVCLAAMIFAGCSDKDYFDPNGGTPDGNIEASTLKFNTTQSVELNLEYNVTKGYVSTFDVYAENPLNEDGTLKSGLTPVTGGINVAGVSKISRVIPAYVKDLYVYTNDLFVPRLMKGTITNGTVQLEQVAVGKVAAETVGTRSVNDGNIGTYLKSKADYYTEASETNFKYDLKAPDKVVNIPSEVFTSISDKFKEGKEVPSNSEFLADAVLKIERETEKDKGAEVWISLAHAGGAHNNSLSYFVYTGTSELSNLKKGTVKDLEVINIFQLADLYHNSYSNKGQGLTRGHAVQLKFRNAEGDLVNEFPLGAQIGFILHSNGFDKDNFGVKDDDATVIYSVGSWNGSKTRKKTIYFSVPDPNDENISYPFFGFEDMLSGGDNDCNDVIFHVLTNPIKALNPPFIPVVDRKEHTRYSYGVLGFEDKWPSKHDYDLNDVVVKYESAVTTEWIESTNEGGGVDKGEVTVSKTVDKFSLVHTGADYHNGFAYKVGMATNLLTGLTVNGTARTLTTDNGGFVVRLFDDARQEIAPYGSGEATKPAEFEVVMTYQNNKVKEADLDVAPYNPFITPQETNVEIHLVGYKPTNSGYAFNVAQFGQEDDRSSVSKNLWYVGTEDNKFPFAIHLSFAKEDFEKALAIPTEKQSIEKSYPKFTGWVNGGCQSTDCDWYINK